MERESTRLNSVQEAAKNWLTPSKEEQTWRILQGLCPHNGVWYHEGNGHNSSFYRCALCGELDDY